MQYIYINEFGDQIVFGDGSQYRLTDVDGDSKAESTINEASALMQIGSTVTGQKVESRKVSLTGDIKDEPGNRDHFLDTVIMGRGKLIYIDEDRTLYLDVYVQSTPDIKRINPKYFSFSFDMVAPFSYWRDFYESKDEFVSITPLFRFPTTFHKTSGFYIARKNVNQVKTVTNLSPVEVGFLATFKITGIVKNPYITSVTTGQTISLTIDLDDGDVLSVDTRDGSKKIMLTRDGADKSAFFALDDGSEFFKLKRGENDLSFGVDSGISNVVFVLTFDRVYEGI